MLLRRFFPEFPTTSVLMNGPGPERGESHSHPDAYSNKSVRGGGSRRNYVVYQQRKDGDHGCKSDQSVDRNAFSQPFPVIRVDCFEVASHAPIYAKAEPNILVAYWTWMEDRNLPRRTPHRPYRDDYQNYGKE